MGQVTGRIAAALLALSVDVLAAPPALTLQPFVSGLAAPIEIAHANDASGRLFVVEQGGRIRLTQSSAAQAAKPASASWKFSRSRESP